MKRIFVATVILGFLGYLAYHYLKVDDMLTDAKSGLDKIEATVYQPTKSADTNAVAAGLEHLRQQPIKKSPTVKKPPTTNHMKQSSKTRTTQESAKDIIAAKPEPAIAGQKAEPAKNSKWLKHSKAEKAGVEMVQKIKSDEACPGIHCVKDKPSDYALVGVVLETERVQNRREPLMDGRMEMGDAQKQPLLYIK